MVGAYTQPTPTVNVTHCRVKTWTLRDAVRGPRPIRGLKEEMAKAIFAQSDVTGGASDYPQPTGLQKLQAQGAAIT